MKTITSIALGLLALFATMFAQSPEIDKALLPAPGNMKKDATVIKWKPDFTYDTLRKGTNRLVCYDRSGFAQQQPFSVECTSIANIDRAAQSRKFEAAGGTDRMKTQALLDAAEKDGTRVKPEFGSVWYHMMGADKDHLRPHMTIA